MAVQSVRVILYIVLSVLVIWYIYTLLSNRKRTSHSFGKQKKVLEIVNKYPNITARATRQLDTAVKEMGNHFFENGEVNYEAMLDTLIKVKRNQKGVDEKTVQVITAIEEYIRKENPFLHISSGSGALFQKLSNDIKNKDFSMASKDITILYEKIKEVEVMLKMRNRRDFWIGTAIGIIGITISIISALM